MSNKGVELSLAWNDRVGKDFTYGLSLNASYNKNEVTRIANSEGIIHGNEGAIASVNAGHRLVIPSVTSGAIRQPVFSKTKSRLMIGRQQATVWHRPTLNPAT